MSSERHERFLVAARRLVSSARKTALEGPASMPPDMQRRAARRLGLVTLGLGIIFIVSALPRHMAVSAGLPIDKEMMHLVEIGALVWGVISVGMFFYSRNTDNYARVLRLGLIYEVVLCADIAAIEQLLFNFFDPPPRLSFITLVLISFPLVVPARLHRRIAITLTCFAMLPLSTISIRVFMQNQPLPAYATFMFAPTLAAAALAVFLSQIIHRLNIEASAARRMGSYELVDKLGGGGMGEVWRARHRLLVRDAAIKLVRTDGGDAGELTARFEREAQATSTLRSPHTVQLYDFGAADDGTFFYAMELLDGVDLQTLTDRFGPVPAERAVHILKQVCRSLADAHDQGMIHRDIKPANLFLCRLGIEYDYLKVLDFGLVKAQQAPEPTDLHLSVEGTVAGTPAYMAPEVSLGRAVDGRADLYALGCVAYWLLTGQLPYEGKTAVEMAMHHIQTEPPPPSQGSELPIPSALDELVVRCLAKEPEDRPADAATLFLELEAIELPTPWTEHRARDWWRLHLT